MTDNKLFIGLILAGIIVSFTLIALLINSNNDFKKDFSDVLANNVINVETETGVSFDVYIQDQTTRPFDIQVNQIIDDYNYSLAVTPVINDHLVTLDSVVGLSVGDKIAFLEQNGMPQIFFSQIKSISGNDLTLGDPIPFGFSVLATVFSFDNQLNVDGSVNPQVFSLNNVFDQAVDITRVIFKCTDDVEMHDGLFCGIDQLTNGVVFRKYTIDGYYINYFNVVNNAKWGLLAYDVGYTDTGKPPSDVYGFGSRLTFGGQNKHGVVIRLEPGERIELVVQDDLEDISGASLMIEGHFTDN